MRRFCTYCQVGSKSELKSNLAPYMIFLVAWMGKGERLECETCSGNGRMQCVPNNITDGSVPPRAGSTCNRKSETGPNLPGQFTSNMEGNEGMR
jgi:hypothetical protein